MTAIQVNQDPKNVRPISSNRQGQPKAFPLRQNPSPRPHFERSAELRESGQRGAKGGLLSALGRSFSDSPSTQDSSKSKLREWTRSDEQKLDQALDGTKSFEHVDDFHQGSESNCASIAVMKSAMDTFGNQVFQDVDKQPDGSYNVTMKDGYTTNVSPEELQKAAEAGDFRGADSQQESYATLMWAAMANRGAEQGFEGSDSYDEALYNLQNGAVTRDVPELLGLQDYMRDVKPEDVPNTDAVVGIAKRDGGGHAVYIDRGQVDLWGNQEAFDPGGFENGDRDYNYQSYFTFSQQPQPEPSIWSRLNPLNWF